jgi:hypothetical protein
MAPRRSWAKADNPFWSNHVAAWYRSALEAEQYCRKHDLSTTSLMRWARHLLSAEDLRKRAEHQRNLPRKTSNRQHKKVPTGPRCTAEVGTTSALGSVSTFSRTLTNWPGQSW